MGCRHWISNQRLDQKGQSVNQVKMAFKTGLFTVSGKPKRNSSSHGHVVMMKLSSVDDAWAVRGLRNGHLNMEIVV